MEDFPIIIGIGGMFNFLGENETSFHLQSNTENYTGEFNFSENNKIVPGVILKIATEKKVKKIGVLSFGISYRHIFSSNISSDCRIDYQTNSTSGEIITSDYSEYSMDLIQLTFKYIYKINLTR